MLNKKTDKNGKRENIFDPKSSTLIGTWNARTLKSEENI